MKVIRIYSDEDYGVINLQKDAVYGKKSYLELYDLALANESNIFVAELEEVDDESMKVYIEACNFPNVNITQEFLAFLNEYKDYDETKNDDWFIVE